MGRARAAQIVPDNFAALELNLAMKIAVALQNLQTAQNAPEASSPAKAAPTAAPPEAADSAAKRRRKATQAYAQELIG